MTKASTMKTIDFDSSDEENSGKKHKTFVYFESTNCQVFFFFYFFTLIIFFKRKHFFS